MRGHVDSETLAAFREEMLARRKARQVAAHLTGCQRCAGADARLAELPALLGRSPAPPMPAALTARIQAAIAAEAIARTAQTATAAAGVTGDGLADAAPRLADGGAAGAPPAGAGETGTGAGPSSAGRGGAGSSLGVRGLGVRGLGVRGLGVRGLGVRGLGVRGAVPGPGGVPGRDGAGRRRTRSGRAPGWSAGRSRLALRVAAATAAVVVLAGGGYEVSRLLSGGQTYATSSGSGGPRALPAQRPAARNGQNGAAASGTMPETNRQAASTGGTAALPLIVTSTDFRSGQLAAQIRAVLVRYAATPTFSQPKNAASAAAAVTGFADLPACVRHVAAGRHPLLVDVARYNGKPAAVIVLPPTPSAPERVVVVGTSCSATATGQLASTTLPSS